MENEQTEQTGVTEQAADAQETTETTETTETNSTTETQGTQESTKEEVTKGDSKDFSQALNKRTEEMRSKIEKEYGEKYGNYDKYSKIAEYLQSTTGQDIDALLTQVEQQQLQKDAEKSNMSPEALKRIQDAEAKIQSYEERMKQDEQQKYVSQLEQQVNTTAEKYGMEAKELVELMYKENIQNPETAAKVLKADRVDEESIKKQAIDDYINKKSSYDPLEKSGGHASTTTNSPKTFEDADKGALAFLKNQMR